MSATSSICQWYMSFGGLSFHNSTSGSFGLVWFCCLRHSLSRLFLGAIILAAHCFLLDGANDAHQSTAPIFLLSIELQNNALGVERSLHVRSFLFFSFLSFSFPSLFIYNRDKKKPIFILLYVLDIQYRVLTKKTKRTPTESLKSVKIASPGVEICYDRFYQIFYDIKLRIKNPVCAQEFVIVTANRITANQEAC